MKASKGQLKQKYLKWSHKLPPIPRMWETHNVLGSPLAGASPSHRPVTSSKHAKNTSTHQPMLSASKSLEICFHLCSLLLEERSHAPANAPSWQPGSQFVPSCIFVPLPQQPPLPSPCAAHRMKTQSNKCFVLFFQRNQLSLYLALHCNKQYLNGYCLWSSPAPPLFWDIMPSLIELHL